MSEELSKKLEEINKRLFEVTTERKKLSPLKLKTFKKIPNKKKITNKLNPSNFESIITEISLSPYLTKPDEKYSKRTIQLPSIIRDIREKDKELTSSSSSSIHPKEMNEFKKTFHDVLHYRQEYNPPLRKKHQLPSLKTSISSTSPTKNTKNDVKNTAIPSQSTTTKLSISTTSQEEVEGEDNLNQ